jgi:4-amino-4-deoxy-L-arabinose transferase-like glycosyltransferase
MASRRTPTRRQTTTAAAADGVPPHPALALARRLVVPLLLAVFLVQALTAVRTKSATWDETNYFGMGDHLLRTHQWNVPSSVIHPPLAFYLDAIPVLFADVDRRVWTYDQGRERNLDFLGAADSERGRSLLASEANRGDRLLLLSRLMSMLQALLLGFFVYRYAKSLYGWSGGALALLFFAFCPNMLAHGSLITPDITVTAFSFIAVYALREAIVGARPTAYALAGVAMGLAMLSKFTAVLLLPVAAIILGYALLRHRRVPVVGLAAWLACTLLVFLGGYLFDLTPYVQGIAVQQTHGGHSAFLMGQISADGWWYYCLAAFGMKTPIPVLVFLAAALWGLGARLWRRTLTLDDLALWLPVVAVFAFFSVELRSIGLRYVLPAYPFIFVLAAGAVLSLRRLNYVLVLPLAWYVVGTLAVWPDHLAYFNESVGGPSNGYRYLVDSNLDWGQDLKGLKAFMDSKGIDRIYLSYFGLDAPDRYGIRYNWLPSYELRNPNPQATVNIPRGSYLAISVTNLQGIYMMPTTMFRWLDRYTPVADIGHSIFIYHLQ